MKGVANRDLKLENLLLDREGNTGIRPLLKICDFGFSKHEMNSSAKTSVGTPIYMAPEIIYGSNRYDAKVCHRVACSVLVCCAQFSSQGQFLGTAGEVLGEYRSLVSTSCARTEGIQQGWLP